MADNQNLDQMLTGAFGRIFDSRNRIRAVLSSEAWNKKATETDNLSDLAGKIENIPTNANANKQLTPSDREHIISEGFHKGGSKIYISDSLVDSDKSETLNVRSVNEDQSYSSSKLYKSVTVQGIPNCNNSAFTFGATEIVALEDDEGNTLNYDENNPLIL